MTLIDKIVHYIFILLFGSVLKLVYLSSEVLKKVTLLGIISILVLLTHMAYVLSDGGTILRPKKPFWALIQDHRVEAAAEEYINGSMVRQ